MASVLHGSQRRKHPELRLRRSCIDGNSGVRTIQQAPELNVTTRLLTEDVTKGLSIYKKGDYVKALNYFSNLAKLHPKDEN